MPPTLARQARGSGPWPDPPQVLARFTFLLGGDTDGELFQPPATAWPNPSRSTWQGLPA